MSDDPLLRIPRLRHAEEVCRRAILLLGVLPDTDTMDLVVRACAGKLADALGAWHVAKYGHAQEDL